MALLEARGLTKTFGSVTAANDISVAIEEREVIGVHLRHEQRHHLIHAVVAGVADDEVPGRGERGLDLAGVGMRPAVVGLDEHAIGLNCPCLRFDAIGPGRVRDDLLRRHVLRLGLRSGGTDYGQGSNTGAGKWIPLTTPADPTTFNLATTALAAGGYTGFYRPEDAVAAGFLDRVVPASELQDVARSTAAPLARLDIEVHTATKPRARDHAPKTVLCGAFWL